VDKDSATGSRERCDVAPSKIEVPTLTAASGGPAVHEVARIKPTNSHALSVVGLRRQEVDLVVGGQLQDARDIIQIVQGIEKRLQLACR
jgi:hypothetical protein